MSLKELLSPEDCNIGCGQCSFRAYCEEIKEGKQYCTRGRVYTHILKQLGINEDIISTPIIVKNEDDIKRFYKFFEDIERWIYDEPILWNITFNGTNGIQVTRFLIHCLAKFVCYNPSSSAELPAIYINSYNFNILVRRIISNKDDEVQRELYDSLGNCDFLIIDRIDRILKEKENYYDYFMNLIHHRISNGRSTIITGKVEFNENYEELYSTEINSIIERILFTYEEIIDGNRLK